MGTRPLLVAGLGAGADTLLLADVCRRSPGSARGSSEAGFIGTLCELKRSVGAWPLCVLEVGAGGDTLLWWSGKSPRKVSVLCASLQCLREGSSTPMALSSCEVWKLCEIM